MGCRVMKIQDEDNWIVHQSTSGANFVPMFQWELAAELFAAWYSITHDLLSTRWSDNGQEAFASDINAFVVERFGEEPELHPTYYDAITFDSRTQDRPLRELLGDCQQWLRAREKSSNQQSKLKSEELST